jgi:hypothetical protein
MLAGESTFVGPFSGERMARREYQKPNVLRQDGARPYWYLRYRVRLYNEQTKKFERKEKWRRLGYCDEMTKREAERARDGLAVEVNNQVFALRDRIPFRDFVELYRRDFMPNLGLGTQQKYSSLFDTHLLPALRFVAAVRPDNRAAADLPDGEAERRPVMVEPQRHEEPALGSLHVRR